MRRSRIPPPAVLASFVDVVEPGSVTRSAERLNLTQSAVSHHLAQFERSVGTRLFERTERAIRPTAEAVELARRLRQNLADLAATLDQARRGARHRAVRLAVSPELLRHWLTPRLGDAALVASGIRLEAVAEIRRDVFSTGDADLQIRLGQPSATEEGFVLSKDDEVVVCSPELAAQLPLREAFAAAPFLVAPQSARTHLDWERWLGELFGAADASRDAYASRVVRHTSSFDAMLEACRRGEGFALVRTLLVADDLAAGRLVAPLIERLRAELNYNVIWPKHPAPGEAVRWVAEWLRGQAGGGR